MTLSTKLKGVGRPATDDADETCGAKVTPEHAEFCPRVIGRGHLSKFQDLEAKTPTILTSLQLLTTGVARMLFWRASWGR